MQREQAREGTTHDLGTMAGRIAENRARVERNEDREGRRQAGEDEVEEDEPLLDLELGDGTGRNGTDGRRHAFTDDAYTTPTAGTSGRRTGQSPSVCGKLRSRNARTYLGLYGKVG